MTLRLIPRKRKVIRWTVHVALAVFILLVVVACGDDDDGGTGDVFFIQLTDGSAVSCAGLEGGRTCTFDVEFRIEELDEPARAQLVVEITQAADGSDFSGTFPQANLVTLTPDGATLTGTLTGVLGPPVTELVRFNLFIEVLDSNDDVIASSDTISDLRPQ